MLYFYHTTCYWLFSFLQYIKSDLTNNLPKNKIPFVSLSKWYKTKNWIINSMEQSSSEDKSHSTSQETSWLLRKPKVHYCVHKSMSLVPILSQMNPVHTFPPYFPKIHSNIILKLCLHLLHDLFPSSFLIKILYTLLICPMHATCLPILSSLTW